ncbi:MAG: proline--tRNA ligase [Euryarchaeota archaeon]|nr:proline--tRNA ligase [Euryarchaeota archaeon]
MREKWKNNFSEWYNEIIEKAEILDIRYPVKGLYVWFPYGFKIRKHVLNLIRNILEEKNHKEALFPLLIPEQEFSKEAKHIKGFEDEVYWVTHGGLEPLNVKLALRPTSETAIYPMFAVWIRSHSDMPLKVYQIVNTFRYETKHTRPLIRLREITTFKEAHTAHASYEDAERQVTEATEMYKKFFDALGVPYSISRRPDWDKFPGAEYTTAFDTIFPDSRTLQIATVHNLGQNFAKTFNVQFENRKGEQEYVYQTCYGISDRVIASLLVIHGDDRGLCLMPEVAPIQIVIVPIWFKDSERDVDREAEKLKKELKDLRVHIDDRDVRPGSKYYDWEIKGVPLRIEIGPKDIEQEKITVVRRDTCKKQQISRGNAARKVAEILSSISEDLRKRAWGEFNEHVYFAESLGEAKKIISEKGGIVKVWWCGEEACAKEIENEATADILGIVNESSGGKCVRCEKKARSMLQLGKAY